MRNDLKSKDKNFSSVVEHLTSTHKLLLGGGGGDRNLSNHSPNKSFYSAKDAKTRVKHTHTNEVLRLAFS